MVYGANHRTRQLGETGFPRPVQRYIKIRIRLDMGGCTHGRHPAEAVEGISQAVLD
jgi:hypothetical protein